MAQSQDHHGQDIKSAFKVAQLCKVLRAQSRIHLDGENSKIFEKILSKEGDVDYEIPSVRSNRCSRLVDQVIRSTSHNIGNSALQKCNFDLFMKLLNQGADFTKVNEDGETLLHITCPKLKNIRGPLDDQFFNAVLSAYVNANNFSNPCNKDGLSHFHMACMSSNAKAVELYIENGMSVHEPVPSDSTCLPGYTPLHFAAMSANIQVVEILLAHGADANAMDAKGMTILHILVKRKLEMFDLMRVEFSSEDYRRKLEEQINQNDKIINILMENTSSDNDSLDTIGLSNFHVACTLLDTTAAKHLVDQITDLDHCVNMDSPLWPGYTALHFASQTSLNTVHILISKGANMLAKDSKGLTPLEICIEKYKTECVCTLIFLHPTWGDILFSDDETMLLIFIYTLTHKNDFKKWLDISMDNVNMCIPMDSPIWPGYTPLHLAVLFADKSESHYIYYMPAKLRDPKKEVDLQIIRLLLKNGADLTKQDKQGRTALHLAFRLDNMVVIDVLLRHSKQIRNVSDEDNLTHLHIVCTVSKKKTTFKKCVFDSSEVNAVYNGTLLNDNAWPGSTPLHLAFVNSEYKDDVDAIIKILMKNGADPSIRDAYGLTPIHWLIKGNHDGISQMLKRDTNDSVVEEYGISYLHVACMFNNEAVVQRLLKNGADVNLAIKFSKRDKDHPLSFLNEYDGCTPLHVSSPYARDDFSKLLIEHGADVFAKKADGSIALDESNVLRIFATKVWNDMDLQKRMRRKFGWTKLHLACHLLQIDGFEDIVKRELKDLNAQVFSISPVWKGGTPLHLLMYHYSKNYSSTDDEKVYLMSRILLENGADITVIDEKQNTPVGVLVQKSLKNNAKKQASLLIKYHRDFSLNPESTQGVSHFHIACYSNDLDVVKGFLSHGVDVNHPIDYFSDWNPGCTPLQLASQFQVVDLLINHGAEIHTENVEGCTVIHKAFGRNFFDEAVITKLIECGAHINSQNLKGKTPFEIAITDSRITMEKLMFCIKQGCHVNSCNPISGESYLAIALENYYGEEDKKLWIPILENIMYQPSLNNLGRTSLHNFMKRRPYDFQREYNDLIDKLIKNVCDVDAQDNEGKTALHLAVESVNKLAVFKLLSSGADINVLDVQGKSALCYAPSDSGWISSYRDSMKVGLTIHACRLFSLNLDLCNVYKEAVLKCPQKYQEYACEHDFRKEIDECKEIEVDVRSICLYDFLSETGAVTMYRSLNLTERCKIDTFFESLDNDNNRLQEVEGILRLQYRKAVKRIELFDSAMDSLRFIIGFHLPDLCVENLFNYLRNSDLKNIINVEIEKQDMSMEVD